MLKLGTLLSARPASCTFPLLRTPGTLPIGYLGPGIFGVGPPPYPGAAP